MMLNLFTSRPIFVVVLFIFSTVANIPSSASKVEVEQINNENDNDEYLLRRRKAATTATTTTTSTMTATSSTTTTSRTRTRRRRRLQQEPCNFIKQEILYEHPELYSENEEERLCCELQDVGLQGKIVEIEGFSNEWKERNEIKAGKGSQLLPSNSMIDLDSNKLIFISSDPPDVIELEVIDEQYEYMSENNNEETQVVETAVETTRTANNEDDYYNMYNSKSIYGDRGGERTGDRGGERTKSFGGGRRNERTRRNERSLLRSNTKRPLQRQRPQRRRNLHVTGTKRVLVVRVIANDIQTTSSANQLSDDVFGLNGNDTANLKTQFDACSYSKLQIQPAIHSKVNNGVYEVSINKNVTGSEGGAIRNAITKRLYKDFNVTDLTTLFDYVMYCIPPGTTRAWIAYAYGDYWLSVYNDKWCSSISAQMHEVAHNMGMGHSGRYSDKYGDKSGTMGYSSSADDTPRRCFNAAKSWQFGWYEDKSLIVSNTVHLTGGWEGKLSGLTQYQTTTNVVLIKIPGNEKSVNDYYINFNHQDSFNSETKLGINQVLVVTKEKDIEGFRQSWLVGKLDVGDSYIISEMGIEIIVSSTNVELGEADVTITSAPPTPMPSVSPTLSLVPTETPPGLSVVFGEGFVLSKNEQIQQPFVATTEYSTFDTIYMLIWSDQIDYLDMDKMEYEIRFDDVKDAIKGELENLYNGYFKASTTLRHEDDEEDEVVVNVRVDGEVKLKIEDKSKHKYEVKDIPIIRFDYNPTI